MQRSLEGPAATGEMLTAGTPDGCPSASLSELERLVADAHSADRLLHEERELGSVGPASPGR